eukprot:359014-Chlamydomonas_euryale.AAC.11
MAVPYLRGRPRKSSPHTDRAASPGRGAGGRVAFAHAAASGAGRRIIARSCSGRSSSCCCALYWHCGCESSRAGCVHLKDMPPEAVGLQAASCFDTFYAKGRLPCIIHPRPDVTFQTHSSTDAASPLAPCPAAAYMPGMPGGCLLHGCCRSRVAHHTVVPAEGTCVVPASLSARC